MTDKQTRFKRRVVAAMKLRPAPLQPSDAEAVICDWLEERKDRAAMCDSLGLGNGQVWFSFVYEVAKEAWGCTGNLVSAKYLRETLTAVAHAVRTGKLTTVNRQHVVLLPSYYRQTIVEWCETALRILGEDQQ